ncbi:signal recognition particle, SRP19 subunit [Phlyctochytrium arcticum]|nr:signal recognition particle, SRP19 subunit [Phlyctochytrium arcticum]
MSADDDIDNMDFDLPAHLLPNSGGSSSMSQPMAQEMAHQIPPRMLQANDAIKEAAKTWTAVYPVYLDPSHPRRKLAKNLLTPDPSAVYIAECVRLLNVPAVLDPEKRHPADPLVFGRLKVQIKNQYGQPMNSRITTKLELLRAIAKMYPAVVEDMKKEDPKIAAMAAASRSEISATVMELAKESSSRESITTGGSGSGSGSGKKKGKKK